MDQVKHSVEETIEKFDIKLKSKSKDGVILQLHHTVRGSNGECRRIRFSVGNFDTNQEKVACSDNVGNMFILDLSDLKFWKLSNVGICTAINFIPNNPDTIIAAMDKKFDINFIDIENGQISLSLEGHTAPVKHISFSNKTHYMLTASAVEAIIWELQNYTKFFTLNTYPNAQIQQILFTPTGDHLVACFQNDTVQIWKHDSMKSVKQIIPSELKHMKSIAFTINGRAMVMAGLTPTLIIFSMDTWKALKVIDLMKYNLSGVQQLAFLPQLFDGGANKILAMLGCDCALYLLNLETFTIVYTICPESSGIRKFVVSPTGKYFMCILHLGEVNLYNSSYVFEKVDSNSVDLVSEQKPCTSAYHCSTPNTPFKAQVEEKMRACLDSARLRRILMQYGEYPDKFRALIWRSLLNTPKNKSAYTALVEKGIHPAYKDIEKQFTIHSSVTLKNLKRLLSCLAHWCPLFGVMKFLPGFVFPFVKVLQKDPLLLFECVATVLMNFCQLWFEYAPFPPISILAMIENILSEHDQQLLEHYCQTGITSQTYALKILETAFSEVLSCSEWLILWDHILSNEPAFIIMSVVSYNIVQRNAIIRLKKAEQLEGFFHIQNPIDKKAFLKKSYVFLTDTAEDIHPRKFFNKFTSLEKGHCYQQFTGYPKATICLKLAKKDKRISSLSEKCTLKELTTRSQEKIIKSLNCDDKKSDKSINDGLEQKNESVPPSQDQEGQHKGDVLEVPNCGDGNSANVTEELINSIMQPALQFNQCQQYEIRYTKTKHCRHSKSKRRSRDKKTESLEKEVEKLMVDQSFSDDE